jgi:hypothetical protein
VLAQLLEPPCTDPFARWCGRGGAARLPLSRSLTSSRHHGRRPPPAAPSDCSENVLYFLSLIDSFISTLPKRAYVSNRRGSNHV